MKGARIELVAGPFQAMRRSVVWWSAALAGLVILTDLFWPVFKGSTGISDALNKLPAGILAAFGLQDFGSPAGYLRANLYEILVPILLVAAGVTFVGAQTAGEEAAGRLELYLTQPVSRPAIYLGRALAGQLGLIVVAVVLTLVQIASDAVVGLEIPLGNLASTIALSTCLAALFSSLAFAIACARPQPSLVYGAGIEVAVASYLVVALFSFSPVLEPWSHLSPWSWVLGGDSLEQATALWRYVVPVIAAVVLILIGLRMVARRDIASG
jgi:ABC-2 type transport system permease protein